MPLNKKIIIGVFALIALVATAVFIFWPDTYSFVEREAGFEDLRNDIYVGFNGKYLLSDLEKWQRPPGPTRVGLQVGHWQNSEDELPEELSGLSRNGAGAVWRNYNERDTVKEIVALTADILREEGVVVDEMPATIPPGYIADAFVSVHADGNIKSTVSGFKIAAPRRDYSGKSIFLEELLYQEYEKSTDLKTDPSVSRRMSGYYAFNWNRYEHAIHPMTPAVIVETGFITNATDRRIIIDNPQRAAEGIANGILAFLDFASTTTDIAREEILVPSMPVSGEYTCLPRRPDANSRFTSECLLGIKADSGLYYSLDTAGISSLDIATGDRISVVGSYVPLEALSNFFWYQYDIEGIIRVNSVTNLTVQQ